MVSIIAPGVEGELKLGSLVVSVGSERETTFRRTESFDNRVPSKRLRVGAVSKSKGLIGVTINFCRFFKDNNRFEVVVALEMMGVFEDGVGLEVNKVFPKGLNLDVDLVDDVVGITEGVVLFEFVIIVGKNVLSLVWSF